MAKYILFFVSVFFYTLPAFSQETNEDVYEFAEEMAEFPGGNEKLMQFLNANLTYPDSAHKVGIQGTVIARFIVGSDGSIRDIKIKRSLGKHFDEATIAALEKMPKWKPAMINGRPVSTFVTIPVKFVLQDVGKYRPNSDK
jgi:periplasmic protein TonB